MELMQAHYQWATRPDDERFTSLLNLQTAKHAQRDHSRQLDVASSNLYVQSSDEKAGLSLYIENQPTAMTHWAFGQLCARTKTPAEYLRRIPSGLAADCLNHGIDTLDYDKVQILERQPNGTPETAAFTSPSYGRIWDCDVIDMFVDRFGDGVTGQWRVPGVDGQQVEIIKENTTLYASDRDMWIFLTDEQNRIELPNRRNGKPGSLARGLFAWHSEVGARTFGAAFFYLDRVCQNRIVWGAEDYKEFKIRHTLNAPDRWLAEVEPALQSFTKASDRPLIRAIEYLRKIEISGETIDPFLQQRGLSRQQVEKVRTIHYQEEERPIENVWDAVVGITAYARTIPHQDTRIELERTAGTLLSRV